MIENDQLLEEFQERKRKHLIYSVLIDFFGMATYLLPVFGELGDFFYAPFSSIAIFIIYRRRKTSAFVGSFVGFFEEAFPFTDIFPTATFMWIYTYILNENSSLDRYAKREFKKEIIIENARYARRKPMVKRIGGGLMSLFRKKPPVRELLEEIEYEEVQEDLATKENHRYFPPNEN